MIRVASYCRVSTDREDQANSFAAQQRYFREYIERRPEWELWGIYADEGITGTSTKKRTQFNRMISDAYAGKFSLILTKEVSRFSRNLLDTIAYTRELKALGVGVVFMNDGFSTLDPDAELRLSIMGSIAQEESRKTSARVKWGQTRQMERGVVFGRSMLGYDVSEGKLTVEPEGARIVRLIFHKYGIEKKGTAVIARELREAGIRTFRDGTNWSSSHIVKLLRNEKYVGDLVQKKTITPDFLTHEKRCNRGEEELVILRDHHEPIVTRELWHTVQRELDRRKEQSATRSRHSSRHACSGKIRCGECGGRFVARTKTRKDGSSYLRWGCTCSVGRTVRDELLMQAIAAAVQSIRADLDWLIRELADVVTAVVSAGEDPMADPQKLRSQIEQLLKKKETVIDAYASGALTREELCRMKSLYDCRLADLEERLRGCREAPTKSVEAVLERIRAIVNCERFSASFYRAILDRITIQKDGSFQLRLAHLPQVWHFEIQYHTKSP